MKTSIFEKSPISLSIFITPSFAPPCNGPRNAPIAAAHAESGDFESAIKWSTQAVELGQGAPNHQQLTEELAEYKAGKPWRESKPSETQEEEKSGGEPDAGDQTSVPGSAAAAPTHTADF